MDGLHPDHAVVDRLGGPTRLSDELGYDKERGPQRVANWRRRGIPSDVKLARPELFLAELLAAGPRGPQMNGEAAAKQAGP